MSLADKMVKLAKKVLRMLCLCLLADVAHGDCEKSEVSLVDMKLNLTPIAEPKHVTGHALCLQSCQQNKLCQSYNYNFETNVCEHLNGNKYHNQQKLITVLNWLHLSNMNHACWHVECKNGGTCVSVDGAAKCNCLVPYIGEFCQNGKHFSLLYTSILRRE